MGKSVWAPFNNSACSDECGEKAKAALEVLYASTAYRSAQEKVWKAEKRLSAMVYSTMASLAAKGEGNG